MVERLVRDLAIKEALQDKIKDTLEHNNQSYDDWYAQSDKEEIFLTGFIVAPKNIQLALNTKESDFIQIQLKVMSITNTNITR